MSLCKQTKSLKNNTFGPRSRYRKKPPAAAANQIAGNQKISLGMHKEKNKNSYLYSFVQCYCEVLYLYADYQIYFALNQYLLYYLFTIIQEF